MIIRKSYFDNAESVGICIEGPLDVSPGLSIEEGVVSEEREIDASEELVGQFTEKFLEK